MEPQVKIFCILISQSTVLSFKKFPEIVKWNDEQSPTPL